MAVLSGEVKIAMSITGTGDGVAKTKAAEKAVADLEKKVGETTRSTKAAAAASTGWASSVASVKDAAKPINVVREGFENLRSNGLFLVGTITSIGGALVALAVEFANSGTAMGWWAENSAKVIKAGDEIAGMTERLRGINTADNGPLAGLTGSVVTERLGTLTEGISKLGLKIQELKKASDDIEDFAGFDATAKQVIESEKQLAELSRQWRDYNREAATAIIEQALALGRVEVAARQLQQAGVVDKGTGGAVKASDLFAGAIAGEKMPERTRDYAAIVAAQDAMRRGGGGARDYDPFEGKSQFMRDDARKSGGISRSEYKQLEQLIGEVTGRDDGPDGTDKGGKGRAKGERGGIARDIRDFTAALSEALPGMSEFQTALGSIVDIWTKWGQSSISTEGAVVGSLGAIANAGAAAIKDERARAGILSIIQLGLGLGKVFIPGMQAEAAGHFAAAATLGSVAIFGSGSGGGRGAGGGGGRGAAPTRGSAQRSGEAMGASNVSVTIHGNYYGGRREQEAASDFARLTRRRGNGFADEGRRSAAA